MTSMKFYFLATLIVATSMLSSRETWAADLHEFYRDDTLVLDISVAEIQRTNRWGRFGEEYGEFLGVPAFSNRRGGKFQCTELAHRFLRETFKVPTAIGIGLGNAKVLVQKLFRRFGNGEYAFKDQPVKLVLNSQGSTEPPAPGSIINFETGKFGHVAVVRYVEATDSEHLKIYLIEQHGFPTLRPGQIHPVRSVLFKRAENGKWSAPRVPGIGKPLFWLNYRMLPKSAAEASG